MFARGTMRGRRRCERGVAPPAVRAGSLGQPPESVVFQKLKRQMFPVSLSRGLEIAGRIHGPDSQTPRWYATPVKQLVTQIGDVPMHTVTPDQLTAWHRALTSNSYSPWTVDSYTRAMKAFWNHMVEVGHVETSPAEHLRLYKLPKKKPKDISTEDIGRMVQFSRYNARDHALVRFLADSGARVGEAISMTVSGVDFTDNGGRAIVRGKGYQTRFVFFGEETAEAIRLYLECRPWNAPDELWLSRSGEPLSTSGVYQMFKRIGRRAGIKRFNPHAFRHAFAKRLIEEGASPKIVQELLGHSDITTTLNQYVTFSEKELEEHHARFRHEW